jgi:hypothetical protein
MQLTTIVTIDICLAHKILTLMKRLKMRVQKMELDKMRLQVRSKNASRSSEGKCLKCLVASPIQESTRYNCRLTNITLHLEFAGKFAVNPALFFGASNCGTAADLLAGSKSR